jgi:hypothetical protein
MRIREVRGQSEDQVMKAGSAPKKAHTSAAPIEKEPIVIYTPPPRKPLADITGLDIPPGIDRDELVLEFEE